MFLLRLSPPPPPSGNPPGLPFRLPSQFPALGSLRLPPPPSGPTIVKNLPSAPDFPWRRPCSPIPPSPAADGDPGGGFDEELRRLLVLLPEEMRRRVEDHPELHHLVEIVMDLGRRPLARFPSGDFFLSDRNISAQDLHHATSQVGDFAVDNRAGISRTLHRISAIRNRKGAIIGLTCRVGRAVSGSANLLRDLVKDGGSLLLIGPPGVGKTTIIREIARILADDHKRRVLIVDTSNEIGGDGDIPHAGIGSARRLQVPNSDMQHKVLIEAVENHMPQAIVIDEIGTKLEAMAASTIAQRGIQLVATAHGVTIENLIKNPSLEMLVGGIQSVTLGDEEASRRGVQKTVLERKGPSTFTCGAEIISKTELWVHRSLEATVDALLAGRSPNFEVRKIGPKRSTNDMLPEYKDSLNDINSYNEDVIVADDCFTRVDKKISDHEVNLEFAGKSGGRSHQVPTDFHLYVYGITEMSVLQAIKQLEMEEMIILTDDICQADAFLALHSKLKKNPHIQAFAEAHDKPIFVTKTNSLVQITKAIRALINQHADEFKACEGEEKVLPSEKADALEEVRLAIEQVVLPRGKSVQLLARPSHILSLQTDLIQRYKLKWELVGQEPSASLRILPLHAGTEENLPGQVLDSSGTSGDFSSSDGSRSSQNGVTRLPLLPE